MPRAGEPIVIVGGGPAGSLLAILLARRGVQALVLERAPPFTEAAPPEGRSINLALAARGIEALRLAGIAPAIEPLLLPMRGRMLHGQTGPQRLLPYGQRADEQIYSISRAALNAKLYELACDRHGIRYRFAHRCVGFDAAAGRIEIETPEGAQSLRAEIALAADGAGSAVRGALVHARLISADEQPLDHGYKELTVPPTPAGEFALSPTALHVWPRGDHMLIALPNTDRSFTATLFAPLAGATSFEALAGADIEQFFRRQFPDAVPLMPKLVEEFRSHPTGNLGTIRCRPWSARGRVLLIGDAAHAIVPFHGQGMNAAFEDCVELDRLLAQLGLDWPAVLARFEAERRPNAEAIAEMALENYREMRDSVRQEGFQLQKALAFELERRFPERFIPRYSMVMFHPEIPYREAQRRGRVQAEILERLTRGARSIADVDFQLAARLIEQRL